MFASITPISAASDDAINVAETVGFGIIAAVSDSLFSQYLVAFEVVSVMLTAALIGAIVIARKE